MSGKINIAEAPPGLEGPGFFATTLDAVVGLGRKNSIWPLPFATSCCGIEFMSTMSSHYDLARFGSERLSFTPRQSDSSGGIFDTYSVLQGIDKIIPVDVYVPGCPPRPEQIIDGVMRIQDLIGKESLRRRNSAEYKELMEKYLVK